MTPMSNIQHWSPPCCKPEAAVLQLSPAAQQVLLSQVCAAWGCLCSSPHQQLLMVSTASSTFAKQREIVQCEEIEATSCLPGAVDPSSTPSQHISQEDVHLCTRVACAHVHQHVLTCAHWIKPTLPSQSTFWAFSSGRAVAQSITVWMPTMVAGREVRSLRSAYSRHILHILACPDQQVSCHFTSAKGGACGRLLK